MNNMHIALGAVSVAITKALREMCDGDVLALQVNIQQKHFILVPSTQ